MNHLEPNHSPNFEGSEFHLVTSTATNQKPEISFFALPAGNSYLHIA